MDRTHRLTGGIFAILALTTLLVAAGRVAAAREAEDRWPMEINPPAGTILIYEPQVESFKADILTARAAVSFTPHGTGDPVFGAAWFKARLHTDREQRIAVLEDLEVTDTRFPEATPEELESFGAIVREHFREADFQMSLDELLAELELAETDHLAGAELKNEPPKIFFRPHPALLVLVDGEPELQLIEGTGIMKVVNTPFYILFDPEVSTYYLAGAGSWVGTNEFTGGWQSVQSLPPAVAEVAAKDPDTPQVEDDETSPSSMPEIVVATVPAEILQTDGAPKYTPIEGTMLLRVSNTENDILLDITTQEYFVLLSGRWFLTKSLEDGPWAWVAPGDLPEEFRRIPHHDESARVRASVPGTIEAKEAVMDTCIPQTARIDRKEARLQVTYDGEAKFEPVEETTIQYAVNTSFSVFLVRGSYFCCSDAVWFVGPSPHGPWEVAVEVPAEIYTVPPGNPHYHTTYVHVYDSTPRVVYVGCYPGYLGGHPYRGVVVWGTGWRYRPWRGRVYYPRPCTFGFGVRYNPWTGGWGVGAGFRGPAGGWVGVGLGRGGAFLRGGVGRAGWWGGGGFRRNDIDIDLDRSVNIDNRFHRDQLDTGNIYHRRKDVDRTRDERFQKRDRPGAGTGPAAGSMDRRNNVFAARDGNVYRRNDQGWQRRDGNRWVNTRPADRAATRDRPAPGKPPAAATRPADSDRGSSSGFDRSEMERSYQSRQRGAQRTSASSRARASGSTSGGDRR